MAETEYAELIEAHKRWGENAEANGEISRKYLHDKTVMALSTLLAREERLKEALKPFAAIAMDSGLSDHPDSYAPRPARGKPNMGDFRRARAALNGEPQ